MTIHLFVRALALSLSIQTAANAAGAVDAVFQPTFYIGENGITTGKAFAAEVKGCKNLLFISAYHLFGPIGGLKQLMMPAQISREVKEIALSNIAEPQNALRIVAVSYTPETANPCCTGKPMTAVGDVSAFFAPEKLRGVALRLAQAPAKKGEKLFVIASLMGAAANGQVVHEAVAGDERKGFLLYAFAGQYLNLSETSGAPVVDESGEVVAIHVAATLSPQPGTVIGLGNPVSAWGEALGETCKKIDNGR